MNAREKLYQYCWIGMSLCGIGSIAIGSHVEWLVAAGLAAFGGSIAISIIQLVRANRR